MLPLPRWSARRIAALWVVAFLVEAALVAGIRAYSTAVFAREHAALVADTRRQGVAAPDSTRDLRTTDDSAAAVRFDRRMRRLIAVQQTAVALMMTVALAAAGATITWAWLRVRPGNRGDAAPPAQPAADAPEPPTS